MKNTQSAVLPTGYQSLATIATIAKGAMILTKPRIEDIPIGRENAISRADLKYRWNCDDRTMRCHVAKFRAEDNGDNYVIVSHSQSGVKGYYRTDKPDEIQHFINEINKRVDNTRLPLAKAKRVLKERAV